MQLQNTFEGGIDETTISTGNSGGDSGDALSSINIGAGNGFVYDNAQFMHGGMSARMDLADNPTTVDQIGWTFDDISGQSSGFFYLLLPSAWTGPSTMRICSFAHDGLSVGRIVIGRDALVIQVSDANFAGPATTVGALTFNTWYRIGWTITHSETVGQISASIYLGDSPTPITDGTCTTDALRDTQTALDTMTVGSTQGWVGGLYSAWIDTINVNDEGNTGPFVAADEKQSFYASRRRSWR